MTRFQITFLLALLVGTIACTNNSSTTTTDKTALETTSVLSAQAQTLYREVGMVHDTAMVLMAPLERTQMRIRKTIKNVTEAEKQIGLQLLTDLTKAGEAMMDWMHEFKGIELHEEDYQSMTEEEIMQYLNQEKVAMEAIDQQMRSAIQEGRAYLQRYEKTPTEEK